MYIYTHIYFVNLYMSLFYKPIVDINNSYSELMVYVNILTLPSHE